MSILSTIDILKNVARQTGSQFRSEYGGAVLTWNPDIAIGTTRAYEIIPGISTVIQDVTFHEDFAITEDEPATNTLNLVYCLEGHLYHKFESDVNYATIPRKQNVIVYNPPEGKNHIILPKGISLKLSTIYIFKEFIDAGHAYGKGFFSSGLNEIFDRVKLGEPYRHIGPLSSTVFQYTSILFDSPKLDFVGRLRVEAAILHIIAGQFDTYLKFDNQYGAKNGISKPDLVKVLDLSEYITENLSKKERIKDFVARSGLHAKKLQSGFRHFFGESVNEFIHSARMAKAKELIEITELPLGEICNQIGFESRSYLSRTFSQKYGSTPAEYRNTIKHIVPVYELSYWSNARVGLEPADIDKIVDVSAIKNSQSNITGCLIYFNSDFFQIIEGGKTAIEDLYEKIKKDRRHFNVELIWKGFKGKRTFENWSLAYVDKPNAHVDYEKNLRFAERLEALLAKHQNSSTNTSRFWERIKDYMLATTQVQ